MTRHPRLPIAAAMLLALLFAAPDGALAEQNPDKPRKMTKASRLIRKQEPSKVSARLMERADPDSTRMYVSLSKQRAYLMVGEEVALDTPISSGKSAGMTQKGSFKIIEKDADHRSNIYGNFVDSKGRVVRSGVSLKIDSAPSGTRFSGAPMTWFMRFNGAIGMHVGILPGYPASHGCVRLPADIARMIYDRVRIGTPVAVTD